MAEMSSRHPWDRGDGHGRRRPESLGSSSVVIEPCSRSPDARRSAAREVCVFGAAAAARAPITRWRAASPVRTRHRNVTRLALTRGDLFRAHTSGTDKDLTVPTIGEVFALATTDDERIRIRSDPESFGREAGLTGATLAEFVGAVRFGERGMAEAARLSRTLRSAIDNELGRPWPFADLPDDELVETTALTQACADSAIRSKGLGVVIAPDVLRRYRAWADALLTEVTIRAENSEGVNDAVADAIIAARNLINACERHGDAGIS